MSQSSKSVIFLVGNEEYGIPVEYVISIEKNENITPIPHLPSFVKGIVKSRGELIPVIDFEMVLYQRSVGDDEEIRMIVLNTEEISIGLLVKEAKEILDIPNESLKQIGLMAYQKTAYFSSVANLDERLITIVDPNILVSSLEGIKEIKDYMKEYAEQVQ
ncbi:CheW domain-containing protein [Bacillus sp. FJAT-49736]|uniref:chemotaxis protein CheW n=1 Tax=Bacillus sp. FJAT-49736 TaxID=2833582 RepID=UPI001BC99894|nr:chemotaxis protein CheW [Bacillus sp. FJAT-49736]